MIAKCEMSFEFDCNETERETKACMQGGDRRARTDVAVVVVILLIHELQKTNFDLRLG